MTEVGIITCSNTVNELGCCSSRCLSDINEGSGNFARYAEDGGVRLMGIISCAGCPTAVAPEKVLRRVSALAELGAKAIHIPNCMMFLCPFVNKYKSLIEATYPDVTVVMGTHEIIGDAEKTKEMFRGAAKDLLCQPRKTMTDIVKAVKDAQGLSDE
ncbi:CGGC domain-containing protein [Candidatus Hydrogenedentota bacterium]